MSRVIKIVVDDSDYSRLVAEHGNMLGIVNAIYQSLGIQSHEMTDVEFIMKQIESFPVGYQFTYREIFHDYPEKQVAANAKIVRRLCKDSNLVECVGYDKSDKVRTYRRIEGDSK